MPVFTRDPFYFLFYCQLLAQVSAALDIRSHRRNSSIACAATWIRNRMGRPQHCDAASIFVKHAIVCAAVGVGDARKG